MKRIVTLFAAIIVSALGYYYTFGAKQLTAELRAIVSWYLEELELNGFDVKLDERLESKDRYLITCNDTQRINAYLEHYDIDISDDDAAIMKGLRVGLEISYLKGFFHALSADLYLLDLPKELKENATPFQHKLYEKLISEKLFRAHIDIDQWQNEYSGNLGDIDTVFEGDESLTLLLKDAKFGGEYNDSALLGSYLNIGKITLKKEHDFTILLEKAESSFRKVPDTLYDFNATYRAHKLAAMLDDGNGIEAVDINITTHGKSTDGKDADHRLDLGVIADATKIRLRDDHTVWMFDGLSADIILSDISTKVLDEMQEGELVATDKLLATLVTPKTQLQLKELKLSRLYTDRGTKALDGLESQGTLNITEDINWTLALAQPLTALPYTTIHLDILLSKGLYSYLLDLPQLTLVWLTLEPVEKDDGKFFEFDYDRNALTVNRKPIL